ncbi:MAG: type II toxin-antitoxin system VapC family toxin [Candidatus Firestonebacteria bacterium]|nr:type II toxin-antitoxin system VapC family toxin [Candidatus Firestonebacteria bacterium]
MKEKVYIETTIPSYLTSKSSKNIILLAHQSLTKQWWGQYKNNYLLYTAPITFEEVSRGDSTAVQKRQKILDEIDVLKPDIQIEQLAEIYAKELCISKKAGADALHLAYATFYKMDYLLTWNCTHLANAHVKVKLLQINQKMKIKNVEICTPEQLMED